jgi:hypothetical protein
MLLRSCCAPSDDWVSYSPTRPGRIVWRPRGNFQRMLAQIRLTDDERAAVENGWAAVERLIERLAAVPTLAGQAATTCPICEFRPARALGDRTPV